MQYKSVWMPVAVIPILMIFATIGLLHVIRPRRFMKRFPFNRGGELLREWNEFGIQIFGALILGLSLYGIYSLVSGYLSR